MENMKTYKLILPKRLLSKKDDIFEYILTKHYYDGIFSSGLCAKLLNIEKYEFQSRYATYFKKYNTIGK